MLTWEERALLENQWFPGVRERVWARFRRDLARHIGPDTRVLDAGCGKGSWFLRSHKGQARALIGVDIVVPPQHMLDAFVAGTLDALPFADGSFDIIVCNDVIEHLAHPRHSLQELVRVLRSPSTPGGEDGGLLFFKTPSLQAPATLLTHLLPFGLHRRAKGLLGVPQDSVFPTLFRCNTPRALDACLRESGLVQEWMELVDETFGYLAVNRWTYTLGLMYSRLMFTPPLKPLRNVMLGVYRKV